MIFVGIDIAKRGHYASNLSDNAPERMIICLESTARYGNNLVCYFASTNYKVNRQNSMMQKTYSFVTFYALDLMGIRTLPFQ